MIDLSIYAGYDHHAREEELYISVIVLDTHNPDPQISISTLGSFNKGFFPTQVVFNYARLQAL